MLCRMLISNESSPLHVKMRTERSFQRVYTHPVGRRHWPDANFVSSQFAACEADYHSLTDKSQCLERLYCELGGNLEWISCIHIS